MEPDLDIDATGLLCPLPVLRARKALSGLRTGQVLRLVADDPMALIDIPHFCHEGGHLLIDASPADTAGPPDGTAQALPAQVFLIERG